MKMRAGDSYPFLNGKPSKALLGGRNLAESQNSCVVFRPTYQHSHNDCSAMADNMCMLQFSNSGKGIK